MGSAMSKGIMIAFAGFGVKIEHLEETENQLSVKISVPETSYELDSRGNEMSGMLLVKRIKQKLLELGVRNLVIEGHIRYGEHWTKEDRKNAEENMKGCI